jgi:hypothetical protein
LQLKSDRAVIVREGLPWSRLTAVPFQFEVCKRLSGNKIGIFTGAFPIWN